MQFQKPVKKHVFIGGSIGVGKTSVLDQVLGLIDTECVAFVQEYIDHDLCGEMMLANHLKGKTSVLFFQRYILENFKNQVESERYKKASIVLWERHPMECFFFIEQCLQSQRCTRADYDTFKKEMVDFCLKYEIPDLERDHFKPVACDTYALDVPIVAEIIKHLLFDTYTYYWGENIYCFLYCSSSKEQLNRIKRRGRTCEVECYTSAQQLLDFNKAYLEFIENKLNSLRTWETKGKINLN